MDEIGRGMVCRCPIGNLTLSLTYPFFVDERWLEWLDSKIALLISRDGVDPRDYGGKSYDE